MTGGEIELGWKPTDDQNKIPWSWNKKIDRIENKSEKREDRLEKRKIRIDDKLKELESKAESTINTNKQQRLQKKITNIKERIEKKDIKDAEKILKVLDKSDNKKDNRINSIDLSTAKEVLDDMKKNISEQEKLEKNSTKNQEILDKKEQEYEKMKWEFVNKLTKNIADRIPKVQKNISSSANHVLNDIEQWVKQWWVSWVLYRFAKRILNEKSMNEK